MTTRAARRHLDRRHRRLFTDHGRIVFKFDTRSLSATQLPTDAAPSVLFGVDVDDRRYCVETMLAPPSSIVSTVAAVTEARTLTEPAWFVTAFCDHIRADVPLEPIVSPEHAAALRAAFELHPTYWLIIAIGREQL